MLKKLLLFSGALLTSALLFSACRHTGEKSCCPDGKAHHKHHDHKHSKGGSCCGAATYAGEAVVKSLAGTSKPIKGKVFFESGGDHKVKVSAKITGLPANKEFGFHVHEFGTCEDSGLRAGGHFNPWKKKHGGPASKERHLGDLGNLISDSKGRAVYSTTIKGRPLKFFGRAVIVHENPDDLSSQPTGNSGRRLACGVITASMPPKPTAKGKARSSAKKAVETPHHKHAGSPVSNTRNTAKSKAVQKSANQPVPARGSASAGDDKKSAKTEAPVSHHHAPVKKSTDSSTAPGSTSAVPTVTPQADGTQSAGSSEAQTEPKATTPDEPKPGSAVPAVSMTSPAPQGASKAKAVKKTKQKGEPLSSQTGQAVEKQASPQPPAVPAKKQAPAIADKAAHKAHTGN